MSAPLHNSQIKSKKRVAEHGEVFTAEREVKAMCDLVAQECDRIDSRFLEPACGDGNFLAEILARKLTTVPIAFSLRNIGTVVTHKKFGDGTIIWIDNVKIHIRVKFAIGEKQFIFPPPPTHLYQVF